MAKIGAAVVTHNRLDYLKICLQKIQSQTWRDFDVLVINNNSGDGTKAYLQEQKDLYQIHLEENTGPAGGFYEAIHFFTEKGGYDYLWLMDDDLFPAKDCLEELVKAAEDNRLMYPCVRDKGFNSVKYPGWYGFLLPVNLALKAGLPMKELFFWVEDTEYIQYRIEQKLKSPIKRVPRAKVVHFTHTTKARKPWRYYYEVRNMLYYRLYVQEGRQFMRGFKILRSGAKLFLLSVKSGNPDNVLHFCRGLKDGLFGKIGKTVEP